MVFGTQIVGLYAGGQKILQGVVALAPVVGNVMIPHIARKAHDRATDTWRAAAAAGALMVGIGLIVAVPLIILPGFITHTLFGSEFSRLAEWLPWFGLILFVRYSGAAFGIVLSAIGLQKKRVLGQILAVVAYMAGMAVVRACDLSVTAALASMLTAMSLMGAVYAWHIFKAKRTNYLTIGRLNSQAKTVRQTANPLFGNN
jgi:O-antigen/teichoic acid export membrane protein